MTDILNISWEAENETVLWIKVKLNLMGEESCWEIKSTTAKDDETFENILKVIPAIIIFNSIDYSTKINEKIDMDQYIKFHSQINLFVAKNQFRNVDKNDFLAQTTIEDHLGNLGLNS